MRLYWTPRYPRRTESRVYNLGLLRRQEQEEIFAGVLFLAGVILLGFASR